MTVEIDPTIEVESRLSEYDVDISDEDKTRLELHIADVVQQVDQNLSERRESIIRWRQLYENTIEDQRTGPFAEFSSKVTIPMIHWTVKQIHVRLFLAHFNQSPFVNVKSASADKMEENKALEKLLNYYYALTNIAEAKYRVYQDALIAGFGVTKLSWKTHTVPIFKKDKAEYEEIWSAPFSERIPPERFYFYPSTITDIDDALMVGHSFDTTHNDIMSLVKQGIYRADWYEAIKPSIEEAELTEVQTDAQVDISAPNDELIPISLIDMVVNYDLDGDGYAEQYIVTFDNGSQKILRVLRYPYLHGQKCYSVTNPYPSDTILGLSIVSVLIDLAAELSTLHNQKIDNNTLQNVPAFMIKETSPAASTTRQIRPGDIILVEEMDDIAAIFKPGNSYSFDKEEDRINYYAKLVTGLSEAMMGQSTKGEKTAYEIEATMNEGSMINRTSIRLMANHFVREVWQYIVMIHQFISDEDFTFITDSDNFLKQYDIKQIWRRYIGTALVNTSSVNKETERQKSVFLYEIIKNSPLTSAVDPVTGALKYPEYIWQAMNYLLTTHDVTKVEDYIGERPETTTTGNDNTANPNGRMGLLGSIFGGGNQNTQGQSGNI